MSPIKYALLPGEGVSKKWKVGPEVLLMEACGHFAI